MSKELTITAKDSEKTLKRSFLIYEDLTLSDTDPILRKAVDQVLAEFQGTPDLVKASVIMVMA